MTKLISVTFRLKDGTEVPSKVRLSDELGNHYAVGDPYHYQIGDSDGNWTNHVGIVEED